MSPVIDTPVAVLHEEKHGVSAVAVPHYFMLPTVEALSFILRTRGSFFLEMGGREKMEADFALLQQGEPDFGLCLTSLNTYNAEVALIITQSLTQRFVQCADKRMHLVSCLQEALANAVIHGNLCINCPRNTLEAFDRYYQTIRNLVVTPEFNDKRVYVQAWNSATHLRLCVSHEGHGMLTADMLGECQPEKDQKSGRGLFIIQSLADKVEVRNEGKSIAITFAY